MAEPFRRCNNREKLMRTNHSGVKPIGGKIGANGLNRPK